MTSRDDDGGELMSAEESEDVDGVVSSERVVDDGGGPPSSVGEDNSPHILNVGGLIRPPTTLNGDPPAVLRQRGLTTLATQHTRLQQMAIRCDCTDE